MSGRPLIGVDAVAVGARVTGAGRVLVNVLAHLPQADAGLDYVAFASKAGAETLRTRTRGVDVRIVAPRRGIVWELHGAAGAAAAAGIDLLFTIRELVPLRGPPVLAHVFEPPAYRLRAFGGARRFAKDALLHLALRRSLSRARAVTAGSRTTAEWLRAHAGVEATVVLPGIDPVFFEGTPEAPVDPPYVLHAATGDPRENTELVLRAFASGRCAGLRLVLVGTPARLAESLQRRAAELGVEIQTPGWVSDERLRELYRGALAVVHPSKYEGFAGYPALEAMALGTPVVALDAPGSTEPLTGRALLVRREDPALLADALVRLRDDAGLRSELAERGRAFALTLTWEAAAAGFAAAFRSALER